MENYNSDLNSLKNNPSLIFILGFTFIIFAGATFLNLPIASNDGKSIGFIDALFTSSSAVCVTGLAVVNTSEHWSIFGKVVILLLIQIGGLGIMTMSALVSFFLGKKISLKTRLLIMEERNSDALQGVIRLTKYIITYTFVAELTGAIFLSFVFVEDYGVQRGIAFSLFHAISSFCNAGFDLTGNSMVNYVDNPIVTFTISALVIIGGIGFFVLIDIYKCKRFKKLTLHSKIVIITTIVLLVGSFLLFFVIEYNNGGTIGNLSLSGKIQASIFQTMTTRTAGYNSVDIAALRMPTVTIFLVLMFIGGSPGSTAGGIKTTTISVIIIAIHSLTKGKRDIEIFMRKIPYSLVLRSVAITGIAFAVVIISSIVLTITEANAGYDFLDIVFETVSAFGTVGLTRGLTPFLSNIGKIILSLVMLIGRLGPLTVVLAMIQTPKNKGTYTYPDGKIIIG